MAWACSGRTEGKRATSLVPQGAQPSAVCVFLVGEFSHLPPPNSISLSKEEFKGREGEGPGN